MARSVLDSGPRNVESPPVILLRERDRDLAIQEDLLEPVSRTFALTIPQLPPGLREVVINAYLLCRIVDTIEDEPELQGRQKSDLCGEFVHVVTADGDAVALSEALAPLLSENTLPAEHELVRQIGLVIRIKRSFSPPQQGAIERCIRIMADGMASFQGDRAEYGLSDLSALDDYCYHVAGVVGEMLTMLFCSSSEEIAQQEKAMMGLAVSFGQGLQMVNILKDMWEDDGRSACWLPRDIFLHEGIKIENLRENGNGDGFRRALEQLIAIAHRHLDRALQYIQLIPPREQGIRRFCLWSLGMAILTLQKIHRNPEFRS